MAISPVALKERRALAKAAGLRVAKRKIPRKREPNGARLRYQKLLSSRGRTLGNLLKEVLIPQLPALLAQANLDRAGVRQDTATDDLLRVFGGMRVLFATAHPAEEATKEITNVSTDINTLNSTEHQRQMTAALGIPVIQPETFVQAAVASFIVDNQNLVASLTEDQMSAFQIITSKGIRSGLRVESIRDELIQMLGIAKSRAALLARDQTLKFYGELTELRQRNVGIEEYDWDTSGDARVREEHAILQDTVQRWDSPPIVHAKSGRRAHPGGDYQCRCQAIPRIPSYLLE